MILFYSSGVTCLYGQSPFPSRDHQVSSVAVPPPQGVSTHFYRSLYDSLELFWELGRIQLHLTEITRYNTFEIETLVTFQTANQV